MSEAFRPSASQRQGARAGKRSKMAATQAEGSPRWLADLPRLAECRLHSLGVNRIDVHGGCTVSDPKRYFSYRRDGVTGRHAAMIWLREPAASRG
jgi:copper oxidase (laccase) domain-containing protein